MKTKEKDKILEWIKEGKKYKECKELAEAEGITSDFHNSYYLWQQSINPTKAMGDALDNSASRREVKEDNKKSQQRRAKWSTQKQKHADESQLAKLINQGIFYGAFPFCKSKQLKIEDVNEINVGGSTVACVLYFFPDIDLSHPAIVLVTRVVMFYIKFRAICSKIADKVEGIKSTIGGSGSGIKEEWRQQQ